MIPTDLLFGFRDRENEPNPLKAAGALAGAGVGEGVLALYRAATAELELEQAKLVQRRLKEAILKSTVFIGVPRAAVATGALNSSLTDEEIDGYGPRYETYGDMAESERRAARGKEFFDTIWTPAGAARVRETLLKHHPDAYICNQKLIYEYYIAENRILGDVETELVAIAALITMNCPNQLGWHINGATRHGASESQIRFAYDLGKTVADAAGCRLGKLPRLEDIDMNDTKYV
ncbi:AhpD-like protein [Ilyonectria sp. MPI-CAGE-AT-0026]|nr:AhpD-like protein [Ilyonectria sp. MPI-CAGE-AT-0026]